jgi:hypothetical protein
MEEARPVGPSHGHYLHHRTTQTSMPLVGFEPTIPVFVRAKTVHATDGTVNAIGSKLHIMTMITILCTLRGDQLREDEVHRTCSTHERNEKYVCDNGRKQRKV